jgi:hypothetical protein
VEEVARGERGEAAKMFAHRDRPPRVFGAEAGASRDHRPVSEAASQGHLRQQPGVFKSDKGDRPAPDRPRREPAGPGTSRYPAAQDCTQRRSEHEAREDSIPQRRQESRLPQRRWTAQGQVRRQLREREPRDEARRGRGLARRRGLPQGAIAHRTGGRGDPSRAGGPRRERNDGEQADKEQRRAHAC